MYEFIFSNVTRVLIVNFALGSDDESASEDEQAESLLLSWDFHKTATASAAQHLNLAGFLRALQHFIRTFGHPEDVEYLITKNAKYCVTHLEKNTWMIWGVDRRLRDADARVDEQSAKRAMEQVYACFVLFHGRISLYLDAETVQVVHALNDRRKELRKLLKTWAKSSFDAQSEAENLSVADLMRSFEAKAAEIKCQIGVIARNSPAEELRRKLRSFFAHLFTPAALSLDLYCRQTATPGQTSAVRHREHRPTGDVAIAPFPTDSSELLEPTASPFHAFVDYSVKCPFYADRLCMLAVDRAQQQLLESFRDSGLKSCAFLFDGHVLVSSIPDVLFQSLYQYLSGRDFIRKVAMSSAVRAGVLSMNDIGRQEDGGLDNETGTEELRKKTAQGFYTKDGGLVVLGDRMGDEDDAERFETYLARPEVKLPASSDLPEVEPGDIFFGRSIHHSNIYIPTCYQDTELDEDENYQGLPSNFLFYQYHRLLVILEIHQDALKRPASHVLEVQDDALKRSESPGSASSEAAAGLQGLDLDSETIDDVDSEKANKFCKRVQQYLVTRLPPLWKTIQTRADMLKASTMAQKGLKRRARQRLARAGELHVPRGLPAWLKQRSRILYFDFLSRELRTHGFQGVSGDADDSLPSILSTLNWPFPVSYALELGTRIILAVDDIHDALVKARGGEDVIVTDLESAWVVGQIRGQREVIVILDKQAPMARLQTPDDVMQATEALLKGFR